WVRRAPPRTTGRAPAGPASGGPGAAPAKRPRFVGAQRPVGGGRGLSRRRYRRRACGLRTVPRHREGTRGGGGAAVDGARHRDDGLLVRLTSATVSLATMARCGSAFDGAWPSGKATGFGPVIPGSNPGAPAIPSP